MRFNPMTEAELQVASLLPEGIYKYQVVKSEDKISKSGNEYIALTLKVWDSDGREHVVFTNMSLMKLLKHFCDVNNIQDQYLSGNLPADSFMNKCSGMVVLDIEPEKPDGKGGMYRAKNIVKDYVAEPHKSMLNPIKQEIKDEFQDSELPF